MNDFKLSNSIIRNITTLFLHLLCRELTTIALLAVYMHFILMQIFFKKYKIKIECPNVCLSIFTTLMVSFTWCLTRQDCISKFRQLNTLNKVSTTQYPYPSCPSPNSSSVVLPPPPVSCLVTPSAPLTGGSLTTHAT